MYVSFLNANSVLEVKWISVMKKVSYLKQGSEMKRFCVENNLS